MTNHQRTILFIGAGQESTPAIILAKEMGLHVVATDKDLNAPGLIFADDILHVSTYDITDTIFKVKCYNQTKRKINGVICVGTDVPLTVAATAQELGLPRISMHSAKLATDKLAMKNTFFSANIPIPWYSSVSSPEQLAKIILDRKKTLVLKPVDNRGARGVLKIDSKTDPFWAFNFAESYSPSKSVIVEDFLEGPQVSTESIVINGRCYTIGFSDRNYEFIDKYSPHIIENGGDLPSLLAPQICESVKVLIDKAACSLGIFNGIVKGDIVIHNGIPHVIEIATRLSGGYFCTHEIPLNTGVNFVKAAILQCLGDEVLMQSLTPSKNIGVSQRYLFPKPGIVTKIELKDWLRSDPDIALCEIRVKIGDVITQYDCHPARAGVVIATGPTREHAVTKAIAATSGIIIKTVPSQFYV